MFTAIKMAQLCNSALRLNLNEFHHFAICYMIQGRLQNRKTISINFENTFFFRSFFWFTYFLLPFLRWPQIHGKHKSVRKRTHKWVRGRQSDRVWKRYLHGWAANEIQLKKTLFLRKSEFPRHWAEFTDFASVICLCMLDILGYRKYTGRINSFNFTNRASSITEIDELSVEQ